MSDHPIYSNEYVVSLERERDRLRAENERLAANAYEAVARDAEFIARHISQWQLLDGKIIAEIATGVFISAAYEAAARLAHAKGKLVLFTFNGKEHLATP